VEFPGFGGSKWVELSVRVTSRAAGEHADS
jgi:hypothetical protein